MTKTKGKLKVALSLLICSISMFFMFVLSACGTSDNKNDIFKLENVNKFVIGETKAVEVTETLGQPYEKNSNNVWCWYEGSYVDIDQAMIKAFEDLNEDKLIKLEQDLDNLTFKFIMVRFEDARVAEVFLDMNHKYDLNSYFESSEEKTVKTVNVSVDTVSGYTIKYDEDYEETYIEVDDKVYSTEYVDGSYYSTKADMFVPEYNNDKTQVTLKFRDDITDHEIVKPFNNKYTVDGEGTLIEWKDTSVTELILDENIVKIPMEMFEEFTNLTKITYSGTKNDWVRFHGEELTYNITCSDGVMGILSQAELDASPFIFEDSTGKKIIGVKDNTMEEIIIPYFVEDVADDAFDECVSAKSLIVLGDVNNKINTWKNCPLEYIEGPTTLMYPYAMSDGILKDSTFAFEGVKEIVINNVNQNYFDNFNIFFTKCKYLESISLSENVKNNTKFASLGGVLYSQDFSAVKYIPANLDTLVIPKSWTSVPNGMFSKNYRRFKNVIFEEGSVCETIERNAFYQITNSFIAPETLKIIKTDALYLDNTTEELYLPAGLEQGIVGLNAKNATTPVKFRPKLENLENWTINAGSAEELEQLISSNGTKLSKLTNINVQDVADLYVKDNIVYNSEKTKIILAGRWGMGKEVIPNSVVEIGKYAFYGSDITELDFANRLTANLTTIGYCAFDSCHRLTRVVIPANVENIANNAFNGCGILVEVLNLTGDELTSPSPLHEITSSSNWEWLSRVTTHDGFRVYIDEDSNKNYILDYIGEETEVVIPSHMTIGGKTHRMKVKSGAFMYIDYYNFTKLTLENSLEVESTIFRYHIRKRKVLDELIIGSGVELLSALNVDSGNCFEAYDINKATLPLNAYAFVRFPYIKEIHFTGEGEFVYKSTSMIPSDLYLPNTLTSIEKYAISRNSNLGDRQVNVYFDGTMEEFYSIITAPMMSRYEFNNWNRLSIHCTDATLKYISVESMEEYNSIALGENEYLFGLAIKNVTTYETNMFAEHEYLHDLFMDLRPINSEYPTIKAGTFNGCDELKFIHVDNSYWNSTNKETGWDNDLWEYEIFTSING